MKEPYQPPIVVERWEGEGGELQLQRRGGDFELIYNGVFLMATYNGAGEREMVREGLRPWEEVQQRNQPMPPGSKPRSFLRILMGGLGFGLGLQEALRFNFVQTVDLLEVEEAVIRWNRGVLQAVNGGALQDPRVHIHMEDMVQFVKHGTKIISEGIYHTIILDTDNGPDWLSRDANRFLYSATGTALLKKMLVPGGTLSVWSASAVPSYYQLLKQHFPLVHEMTAQEQTGQNSYYYLAING